MQKLTVMFIFALILIVALFDVYVIMKGGTEASISHTIYVWSYKYPPITFAFGFLCGHLFWRIRDTEETKKISDNTRE